MAPKGGEGSGEYKMVLVIRGELRLTPGKIAVQAAHAAVMLTRSSEGRNPAALDQWLRAGQKKIALVVPTLADLEQLDRAAKAKGVPTVWVEDAGLTEVAPGTRTCLGLGPARASQVDAITGSLALL